MLAWVYYGSNTCIEYAIMHICRFMFVCVSICLFTYLRLMSARLSIFLFICLSVCLYVGQSSVCRLLCLLLSIHHSVCMLVILLSVFRMLCLLLSIHRSVCMLVILLSVCRLLCLLLSIHRSVCMSFHVLGRVPIYFSLCVVHCANPILLIPSVLLLVLCPSTYIAVRYCTFIFVVLYEI